MTVKEIIDKYPSNYVTICNTSYYKGCAYSITKIHGKIDDFYRYFERDVVAYFQDSTNLYIILKEEQ